MVDVPSREYQSIENYGVIGDLYTVALVGMDDLSQWPLAAAPPTPQRVLPVPGAGHDRRVSRPAACGLPVALPAPRPLENAV